MVVLSYVSSRVTGFVFFCLGVVRTAKGMTKQGIGVLGGWGLGTEYLPSTVAGVGGIYP